jgi:hypothetical protein
MAIAWRNYPRLEEKALTPHGPETTFRRFLSGDVPHRKRVIADESIAHEPDIGLGRACLLVLLSIG